MKLRQIVTPSDTFTDRKRVAELYAQAMDDIKMVKSEGITFEQRAALTNAAISELAEATRIECGYKMRI